VRDLERASSQSEIASRISSAMAVFSSTATRWGWLTRDPTADFRHPTGIYTRTMPPPASQRTNVNVVEFARRRSSPVRIFGRLSCAPVRRRSYGG
jgi:hypothetical protein